MKFFNIKSALGLSLISFLAFSTVVSAQILSPQPYPIACTQLTHALAYGSRDYTSGGDVTALQTFLSSQGLFALQPTGFYGSITAQAVAQFQASHGIPTIGIVGPLTRAAIAQASCNGGIVPPTQTPTIYNVTPSSGRVGTQVTIVGSGLTNDNTIHFGSGVVMHVPAINQTLTFTVPESLNPACYYSNPRCMIASIQTTPGVYTISIENSNGTSNSVQYTVVAPVTQSPIIYSITPNTGSIGAVVTLTGSFTQDSYINFGGGGVAATSNTGSAMTFVVPQYLNQYCPPARACTLWIGQTNPGNYAVSVYNSVGTSNSVNFTVQ